MSTVAGYSRAALLGVLFALVGFSYAVATSFTSVTAPEAAGRGVGTSQVFFTNPLTAGPGSDRDLGDVVAGSQFTRFVRAAGGLPPYRFTSTGTQALSTVSSLTNAVLALNGRVSGSVSGSAASDPRFSVTVTDAYAGSNTVTEVFRLTLVTGNQFKFAIGPDLGTATQFQSFTATLETLNGRAPFTFSAANVKLNGTAVNSLEELGLSLSNDGILFGKPFRAGTVTFDASATDANTTAAAGRNGTGSTQAFSLVVGANDEVTSDAFYTKAQIKTGAAGKDSVSASGILNLNGSAVSALSGKTVTARFGKFVTTSVTFDAKGKAVAADKTVSISVKSTGGFSIKATKQTLQPVLGTFTGATAPLATGLLIQDSVNSNEILTYSVKSSKTTTLSYSLGKNVAPAGGFLITKLTGKDTKAGNATAYNVAFVAIPAGTTATTAGTFGAATQATVGIGNVSDTETISVSKGKVKQTSKVDKNTNNKVSGLKMDEVKGKGGFKTTGIIFGAGTVANPGSGIPSANVATTGTGVTFPLSVELGTATTSTFAGSGSVKMFSSGKGYSTKNPTK